MKPKYAVIEVGKGNSYGHPTQETLDKLSGVGVTLYRTDLDGSIVATSDGKTITWDKQPAASEFTGFASKSQSSGSAKTTTSTKAPTVATTPSPSQPEQTAPSPDNGRIVYWTPNGKSYHYSKDCPTLKRSKTIESGTIDQAIASGHGDPCNDCVK